MSSLYHYPRKDKNRLEIQGTIPWVTRPIKKSIPNAGYPVVFPIPTKNRRPGNQSSGPSTFNDAS
ncbi:hypothetical protein HMPREF9103_00522 [Lentilactobacillus parafarraginis F0439]|uniref:Uncharacterized protein n=1 Tax=Lentilactobacillus parafarraginis F0439 TaxID=797515 RepID=G9ZLC4_9LACO|nr:hypothetical protein HMPREF9103_00522 [Lentilactobacillus parafarraginis F0439]